MKKKSETFTKFVEYVEMAENVTSKRLKRIRSDNGGEYVGENFLEYCRKHGIKREETIPYTPQQNGVSERMNRTLMDNVRAMLYHGNLPLWLWAEAVSTAVYLRNRSPTSSFKGATPYERWYGVKPDVEHLRIFGCNVMVHIPDEKRRKLDKKSLRGVFVGYPENSKGYKIYNPENRSMLRSRDVIFLENSFGNLRQNKEYCNKELLDDNLYFEDSFEVDGIENGLNAPHELNNGLLNAPNEMENVLDEQIDVMEQNEVLQRPQRDKRQPVRYGEWDYASLAVVHSEPRNYKEALNGPYAKQWKEAMNEEYKSLMKHKTWTLVKLPQGRNVVGSKWVYKAKQKANGDIDRYKARLVARGFSQEAGVDYDEVFAPVARYNSIRSVLAIANQLDLEVHQMDVKSAFLNGDLENEIFMKQPEGFVDSENPDYVCLLKKSLYGLKQSARCWNLVMDEYLKSNGYKQSTADMCIYYKSEVKDGRTVLMIIAVYVDDTILASNNMDALNEEKRRLSRKFEMDDRGEVHYVLGMSVKRNRNLKILTIDQRVYLENVLKRFGMQSCKPIATPLEPGKKFEALGDDDPVDVTEYQAVIGSLTYAVVSTRPDLAVAVGMLSQFMKGPGKEHWTGIKRVLRYIKGTLDYGLKFVYSKNFVLYGYSDADWAGDIESRKSTSGYVFRLGGCTISWKSKKQPVVALSSTEAEYVALCHAAQETVWLRNLLHSINLQQSEATILYEDNQGAMALSNNPKDHTRTKHIDVKYHYVRETIEHGYVNLMYCPTENMVADMLTKGLPKQTFEKFRSQMGVDSTMDLS